MDVSALFAALDDEEFFVLEGSGWQGRQESYSQVFSHTNLVHASAVMDKHGRRVPSSTPPPPTTTTRVRSHFGSSHGGSSPSAQLFIHCLHSVLSSQHVVQVVSCFSCAVLPFLVRSWSGLAHANGIKSPSISMPSLYSQCALRGAWDVSEVSLPWSLSSCSPALPPSTTPSSQTSLGTQVAFSLLFLRPCGDRVQMLPVVGPLQISWAWHVDKSVLYSTLSTVKFDDFVYWLVLLPAAPSLLDDISGPGLVDAAMLMLPFSENWPVLVGAWPAPCFQPYVFAALNAALLLVVFQVVLLVFGRNILVSPWLLDLTLSPSASPTSFLR